MCRARCFLEDIFRGVMGLTDREHNVSVHRERASSPVYGYLELPSATAYIAVNGRI